MILKAFYELFSQCCLLHSINLSNVCYHQTSLLELPFSSSIRRSLVAHGIVVEWFHMVYCVLYLVMAGYVELMVMIPQADVIIIFFTDGGLALTASSVQVRTPCWTTDSWTFWV